uniref:Bromodomain-containing protein DDB_G0270170-like n=1 Tax=Dermatophagoides pteronyssinus TaxID=6956 RepID=A0A6P6YHW8_DERPT|nr:bromodomain-containing protein DDB_G0270170-like [Dermatophagoides pteronyssinus]
MMEKAGHICLTKSLEYAFQRTQTLTTECPDCGLRLIIRYDHLVNRASSWGVIIGLSALIGYHLGVNRDRILKLTRNLLKFLNFHNDNESRRQQQQQQQLYDNMRKIFRKYHKPTSLSSSSSSTSSLLPTTSNDSAFDTMTISSDYDDYQFTYNKYYDDLFNNYNNNNYNNNINDSPNIIDNNRINNRFFQSKTVDKIDQVLHQIDDIKKSIVEIDDELYHVTGSKYANFNPDFLTLSNVGWFDDDDSLSDCEPISSNKMTNHMSMDSRRKKSIYRKRRNYSTTTKDDYHSNHQMMTTFKANDQNQPQQTLSNNVDNDDESLELEQRRSSRQSFISTSEQLEWDEIECEFCFPNQSPSTATIIDTNDETMENSLFIDEKSIQTSNLSSSTTTQPIIMMTDEQKLQNMQDLLEEAKRLGLLNNIIDAFLQKNSNESILNQSSTTTITKTLRKLSSSDQDDDYDDDDIDAYQ